MLPKRSHLVEGGLKIPILVSVTWANARTLNEEEKRIIPLKMIAVTSTMKY